jgi:hypothetical protein
VPADQRQGRLGVRRGEERQRRLVFRVPIPVRETRLFLLEVSGVEEQHLQQIGGTGRAVDRATEALTHEAR